MCISEAARSEAIARGAPAQRTSIVGIGVAAPDTAQTVRESGLIVFVGRLVRRKGLAWFVHAVLPGLVGRHPGVRLAIVGTGPERAAIQDAADRASVAHHLKWLGAVSDSEKWTLLQRAPICIAPNVRVEGDIEGYGIVALEAAAAGCALVAADLEGLRDAVVDGEGGALVPAEDAAAWTTALLELLADPARAAQLGARARIWATAERSWDLICDRYEEIFDQLAPDVG